VAHIQFFKKVKSSLSIQVMRDRLFPKFLVPDGKSQLEWNKIFVEEQRQAVNVLMQNLESMPVTKRLENSNYGARALQNMSGVVKPLSRIDKVSDADDSSLTKSDISLMFTIELVVQEVTHIKNADAKRKVYCTMEMEGGEKMATNAVPSTAAKWDCQADFRSNQIRPCLKVKLFQKSKNMLAIEDKELGRVLIKPLPNTPTCTEWYTMYTGQKNKSEADYARIRLGIRIDKPANLKHCGYLYAQGKQAWKKWKMRFFALVQVSQYTFAMCSFQERKTDPHEMVQLDGFTVDYSLPESGLEGGTVFFNAMKESDSIIFSCSGLVSSYLQLQYYKHISTVQL
jgi:calcium-dependent secretion activator